QLSLERDTLDFFIVKNGKTLFLPFDLLFLFAGFDDNRNLFGLDKADTLLHPAPVRCCYGIAGHNAKKAQQANADGQQNNANP
ncbi:MAG TPA: hypothetical protein PLE55_11650, partial [Clostridiales bacterium]|nr:hypothetical protein [Clostridiales bacterium]